MNNDLHRYEILTRLSQGEYAAFLYDCDGTLADNMQAHKESYAAVAAEQGCTIDLRIIDELAGWPIVDVVEEINRRYGYNFDAQAFVLRKAELFTAVYLPQVQPIRYVVQHLVAHAGKVKIGVVSGGSRTTIAQTLELLGIASLVEVLVCAGETPRGKPHPDPFLKAAALLGVAPQQCLVLEDGDAGTRAADGAGMHWIRIDQLEGK